MGCQEKNNNFRSRLVGNPALHVLSLLFRRISSSQPSSVPGSPLPLPVDVTQQICVDVQTEIDDVVKVLARAAHISSALVSVTVTSMS
jgi:hypothetical protein